MQAIDQALDPVHRTADGERDTAPTGHSLFIIPTRPGNGFVASVRGHMMELADPTDCVLAPSPDDLLVAAIASDLAWSARRFLRASGLPDDVSVSAEWRTHERLSGPADVKLSVTVSRRAEAVSPALRAAVTNSLASRSLAKTAVYISFEGGKR